MRRCAFDFMFIYFRIVVFMHSLFADEGLERAKTGSLPSCSSCCDPGSARSWDFKRLDFEKQCQGIKIERLVYKHLGLR